MRTQRTFKPRVKSRQGKRGNGLERIIDMTNNQYRNSGIADVRKVPTPVQITENKGKEIVGRLEKATWVDYSGVYQGKAIIFDAKETSQGRFPISKLADHQYSLLESWHKNGAIAFLIVHFTVEDKYYYLPFEVLERAWERAKTSEKRAKGTKSITLAEFKEHAIEIKSEKGFVLHYLKAV